MRKALLLPGPKWYALLGLALFLQTVLLVRFPPDLSTGPASAATLTVLSEDIARSAGEEDGAALGDFRLHSQGAWALTSDRTAASPTDAAQVFLLRIETPPGPWNAAEVRIEDESELVWSVRVARDHESQLAPAVSAGGTARFEDEHFPGVQLQSEQPLEIVLRPEATGETVPRVREITVRLSATPEDALQPGYPGVMVGGFLPLALAFFLRYMGGRKRDNAIPFGLLIGGIGVLLVAFREPQWLEYLWAATAALFLGAGANNSVHSVLNPKSTDPADLKRRKALAVCALMAGLVCVALWMRWETFEEQRGAPPVLLEAASVEWAESGGMLLGRAVTGAARALGGQLDEPEGQMALRLMAFPLTVLLVIAYFAAGRLLLGRKGGLLMAAVAAASPFTVEKMGMEPGLTQLGLTGIPAIMLWWWFLRYRSGFLPALNELYQDRRPDYAKAPGIRLVLLAIPALLFVTGYPAMPYTLVFMTFLCLLALGPKWMASICAIFGTVFLLTMPPGLIGSAEGALATLPRAAFGEQWGLLLLATGLLAYAKRFQDALLRSWEGAALVLFIAFYFIVHLTLVGDAVAGLATLSTQGQESARHLLHAMFFPYLALGWAAGTLALTDLLRRYARRQLDAARQAAQKTDQ